MPSKAGLRSIEHGRILDDRHVKLMRLQEGNLLVTDAVRLPAGVGLEKPSDFHPARGSRAISGSCRPRLKSRVEDRLRDRRSAPFARHQQS